MMSGKQYCIICSSPGMLRQGSGVTISDRARRKEYLAVFAKVCSAAPGTKKFLELSS